MRFVFVDDRFVCFGSEVYVCLLMIIGCCCCDRFVFVDDVLNEFVKEVLFVEEDC